MPTTTTKYSIRFDEGQLRFSENYPNELADSIPIAEYDSVIRKINEDMAGPIRELTSNMRKWVCWGVGLSMVVVGMIFPLPMSFVKVHRHRKAMKKFWEDLRTWLGEINRKTFLKRNFEWKLVEDKKKLKGRDVVNPLMAYRIELIHRVQKTKVKPQTETGPSMTQVAASGRVTSTLSTASTARNISSFLSTEPSSVSGVHTDERKRDSKVRFSGVTNDYSAPLSEKDD